MDKWKIVLINNFSGYIYIRYINYGGNSEKYSPNISFGLWERKHKSGGAWLIATNEGKFSLKDITRTSGISKIFIPIDRKYSQSYQFSHY